MILDPQIVPKVLDALIENWPALAGSVISAVAAGAFSGWRARRKFHAQTLNQDQSEAYKRIRDDFVAIRLRSARDFELYWQSKEWPPKPAATEEERAIWGKETEAMRQALSHLRQVYLVGGVDISRPAFRVVEELIVWRDGDDHSDGEGIVFDWDHWSKKALLDFEERRLVDLGRMSFVTWSYRRAKRAVAWKARVLAARHWWLSIDGILLHRKLERDAKERARRRLAEPPIGTKTTDPTAQKPNGLLFHDSFDE
jgi:hypothetical protein